MVIFNSSVANHHNGMMRDTSINVTNLEKVLIMKTFSRNKSRDMRDGITFANMYGKDRSIGPHDNQDGGKL